MSVSQILILVTYLMCWQGYRLRGRVSGLGHVALILSLAATLANATTARLSAANPHSLIAGQYIALVEHVFVVISCVGLYVFRLAIENCTLRSRRVLLTIGGGLAVSLLLSVITYVAITRGPLISVTAGSYRSLIGFTYAFVSGMYFGLVMFVVAQWMRRYVRDKEIHFRWGIRIAALGIYALSALSIVRALPVAVVFLGGPNIVAPGFILGGVSAAAFPLVFIGLSYPLLVGRWQAFRYWNHKRRVSNDVRVVWALCQAAFPEIALRSGSSLPSHAKRAIWNPDELSRLTTESFDGLSKLFAAASAGDMPPLGAVEKLRQAVRSYDQTHEVSVREIIAPAWEREDDEIPSPPEQDIELDMLIALSKIVQDGAVGDDQRVRT